jgi:hypothetical protein
MPGLQPACKYLNRRHAGSGLAKFTPKPQNIGGFYSAFPPASPNPNLYKLKNATKLFLKIHQPTPALR